MNPDHGDEVRSAMTYATWDPTLETGNELVDSQHKQLFELINELHDAIVDGHALETQQSILDRLLAYAETHFLDEEKLMASVGYPELAAQQEMHREYTFETNRLAENARASEMVLPITLAVFLHEWLAKHIRIEDRKIGEYIRSQER